MRTFTVRANWDPEAKVWVATSEDVPGLATEAESIERLFDKLKIIVPELLEANGVIPSGFDDIPIDLLAQRHEHLKPGKPT